MTIPKLLSALALFSGVLVVAQEPLVPTNPSPGCSATPAELAANKKVAMEFFRPGGDRISLADPSYKQHNPAFKKRAEDNHTSDYDEFKATFTERARGGGRGRGAGDGPQPPPGNQLEIVTAECDLVTIVHKNYRPDPTADPGKFYEVFTFDTFRVKNGKLVEHWDSAVINPPGTGRGQ
jgi:predicted SnoaL-like aldol condensation-catalyzing enzyme